MESLKNTLDLYLSAILELNKNINFTSISDFNDAKILHLKDSLSAVLDVKLAPKGPMIDLGTGGGFPGVPLSLATGRSTTLIDARSKKINALTTVLERLSIEGVACYAGRIEELALEAPNHYAVATARALASLPSLLELSSPLIYTGGRLIAFKTFDFATELERALSIERNLGFKFLYSREVRLGGSESPRAILVFEKVSSSYISLPRRVGLAQNRPLA